MYEQTVVSTKTPSLYKTLLGFYPKDYINKFGLEMLFTFEDLYQEELTKSGKVGGFFWLSIFADTAQSAGREHLNLMQKQGFRNYFHLNNYNIVGFILLLPFTFLFGLDLLGRIVQRDLVHYNRAWYGAISHSFFYADYNGKPVLLFSVLIVLPVLAILLNSFPLFFCFRKKWV